MTYTGQSPPGPHTVHISLSASQYGPRIHQEEEKVHLLRTTFITDNIISSQKYSLIKRIQLCLDVL